MRAREDTLYPASNIAVREALLMTVDEVCLALDTENYFGGFPTFCILVFSS